MAGVQRRCEKMAAKSRPGSERPFIACWQAEEFYGKGINNMIRFAFFKNISWIFEKFVPLCIFLSFPCPFPILLPGRHSLHQEVGSWVVGMETRGWIWDMSSRIERTLGPVEYEVKGRKKTLNDLHLNFVVMIVLQSKYPYFHFTDEKTETERGFKVIYLRLQ